jgi:hypothetical protein
MIVSSGSGVHAYWALSPAVGPDEAEAANRRLAHALGADAACADMDVDSSSGEGSVGACALGRAVCVVSELSGRRGARRSTTAWSG